jgi:hypothetical protein
MDPPTASRTTVRLVGDRLDDHDREIHWSAPGWERLPAASAAMAEPAPTP